MSRQYPAANLALLIFPSLNSDLMSDTFIESNEQLLCDAYVSKSSLGGYGLFASRDLQENAIIIRIPHDKVLDIHKLLKLRQTLVDSDSLGTVTQVFQSVLRLDFDISESMIIWCHLCALVILRNNPNVDTSVVLWLLSYVDILLSTEVLDVDLGSKPISDALVLEVVSAKQCISMLYRQLLDLYPDTATCLKLDEAFQLFQAVRSRVLEIPYQIGEHCSSTNSPQNSEENYDDFETNISLIPMLDFTNHSFSNNAVFDVHRASGDVLLRLVMPVHANEEITICYSPISEKDSPRFMNLFFTTYSFLPNQGSFTWNIENFDQVMNGAAEYEKIAQWLRVPLELSFYVGVEGSVSVDLVNSLLPLLFIPGLEYNPDWRSHKDEIHKELSSKAERSAEDFISWLSEQESSGAPVCGLDMAYGVLLDGVPVEVNNVVNQAGVLSDESIELLERATMQAVLKLIRATLEKGIPNTKCGLLQNYYKSKNHILSRFLNHHSSN